MDRLKAEERGPGRRNLHPSPKRTNKQTRNKIDRKTMNKKQRMDSGNRSRRELALQALDIFKRRGKEAVEIAENTMLKDGLIDKPVEEALEFFMCQNRQYILHPALVSLACEAVGGDPERIASICASIVLVTSAFDIHDDIMDQSTMKGRKQTVFGKFGTDIALLAGDALFMKGLATLHKACDNLSPKGKQAILDLAENSFIELGNAQAKEASFKGKLMLPPSDYVQMVEMKASISEAEAKMGAIAGNGVQREVEALGRYGRKLGILAILRDDFIDIFEPKELQSRLKNECLPLPLLYALQNKRLKARIMKILTKTMLADADAEKMVDVIWDTSELATLRKQLRDTAAQALQELHNIRKSKAQDEMQVLVYATIEDLDLRL